MVVGYIILGVVCAGFLAIAIYFIVASQTWEWPKGKRTEGRHRGYRATFIYGADISNRFMPYDAAKIANACALAAWALGTAWSARKPGSKVLTATWCVVHVVNDTEYDATYDAEIKVSYNDPNKKSNGQLRFMTKKVGSDEVPIVACRASTFLTTITHGHLVIHELTHDLMAKLNGADGVPISDLKHEHPDFWTGRSDSPLEVEATELFVQNREGVGIEV